MNRRGFLKLSIGAASTLAAARFIPPPAADPVVASQALAQWVSKRAADDFVAAHETWEFTIALLNKGEIVHAWDVVADLIPCATCGFVAHVGSGSVQMFNDTKAWIHVDQVMLYRVPVIGQLSILKNDYDLGPGTMTTLNFENGNVLHAHN